MRRVVKAIVVLGLGVSLILLSACAKSKQSMCEDIFEMTITKVDQGRVMANADAAVKAQMKVMMVKMCLTESDEQVKTTYQKLKSM